MCSLNTVTTRRTAVFCLLIAGLVCTLPSWTSLAGTPTITPGLRDAVVIPLGYGGGGRFTAVAVDPRNPDTVLVGSDVAGVFKSEDGGRTFQLKGRGLKGFAVADIAFHPVIDHGLVLLTGDGFYLSLDQGETWHQKSAVVRYASRFFGSRLLVFWKEALWIATDHDGVFELLFRDSEVSVSPSSGLEGIKVNALTASPDLLYAATAKGVFQYAPGGSWQPCNNGLDPSRQDIMDIARHASGALYLLEKSSGLYAWDEKKSLWQLTNSPSSALAHPVGYKALALDPADAGRLLVATHPEGWPHHLLQTRDGARSWHQGGIFEPSPEAAENWAKGLNGPERIVFTPRTGELYLIDWWNVWKSTDGGEHWQQLHSGLYNTVVNAVRAHPQDPRKLFLCTCDSGVMVSEDSGRHWRRKMAGVADGHAQGLEFSGQDPQKLFLIMNPWVKKGRVHVYRSMDGGESWHDIGFQAPVAPLPKLGFVDGTVTNLAVDPTDDNVLYVGTNGFGLFETTNGGRDWKSANDGLATPFIKGPYALLIHPRNPQMLFVSTQKGGLYKSLDGGRTWRSLNTGQPFTFGMAIDPNNPSRIFAACAEKRIIVSEDEGNTWKTVILPGDRPPHLAAYAIALPPQCPQKVVVGTLSYDHRAAEGLFISEDAGASFRQYAMDLPSVNVFALETLSGPDCRVMIGFNGIGLHEVRLNEGSPMSAPRKTDELR